MATIEELEEIFDDHPSLNASLQDFESSDLHLHAAYPSSSHRPHHQQNSPNFGYPSHHSGFRSETSSDLASEMEDHGRYSPPAWRRAGDGKRSSGFWSRRQENILGNGAGASVGLGRGSRESSVEFESADEGDEGDADGDATLEAARRTRLPTGSLSPEKRRSPSPGVFPGDRDFGDAFGEGKGALVVPGGENGNNYIRFAVRAEVQHRTEPFEAAFSFVRSKYAGITRSWTSLLSAATIALISILALRTLFQPGQPPPVPDLVKVAGLAKAFEPLIFYSENGVQQIGDLQATGVAVWDLGESVRSTNMTSAPIIVKELDDLSESLKTLAIELTRFFANVDGDVDGILIVMDWARRELTTLQTSSPTTLSHALSNVHTLLSHLGVLESRTTGAPTRLGALTTTLFGPTSPQRTRHTLQRTFTEFLSVLEEAIASELQHSLALFSLFESIDRQFLNLARSVIRESSQQDAAQDDLLSSLWTKILGASASTLHKFETNKKLLANIRTKTVLNKGILLEHNGKLLTLKANLESLRRKLVSPLLRGEGSTVSVEEQIRGLEEVGGYLGGVRERQRGKLMEMLYGAGGRRGGQSGGGEIAGEWR